MSVSKVNETGRKGMGGSFVKALPNKVTSLINSCLKSTQGRQEAGQAAEEGGMAARTRHFALGEAADRCLHTYVYV